MDLIVRANWDRMKEEKEMCEALRELFADELQESKEQGEEKVSLICETARRFAPDYDADQIYAVLAKKETGGVKKP